ncbi:YceD family protein [Kovacikia minuta CCNUW1]|uniref:YceD family protein n=1 Tax=Kovacikia minuta TaxID=2931930 RepID=UPI001CD00DE4|nr:YceD family protein [Kovacikia minuta]UBF24787.1 YceD family protein [Kovacikia minuta CCNUW1]
MEAIYIPRITRAPQQTEVIDFDEIIPGLETLTPVHGRLQVTHQGNYLEVSAQVETIITLTCHRCLQQYNYRLAIAPAELIWLDDTSNQADPVPLDQDISLDDLVETLPPNGYFDPTTWLYEQLCLEIPQRQLCDQACQGIPLPETSGVQPSGDRRWASLEALKQQLSDRN